MRPKAAQHMLPCFLFAMYEKHGQPLETLIKNIIQTKFIRPKERPYQTENFYAVLERQRQLEKEVSAIVNGKRKTRRKQAYPFWLLATTCFFRVYWGSRVYCELAISQF